MAKKPNLHIRWLIRRDMPEVLDIAACSVSNHWHEEEFLYILRKRNCIGMIVEHNERIVGFMVYELHSTHLHLLNFAVHKDMRKCGVGTAMVQKLIGKLGNVRKRMVIEVRETNLDACFFFRSQGFRATSLISEFYDKSDDSKEDAIFFQYGVCAEAMANGK